MLQADEWDEIYEKGKVALERGAWEQAKANFGEAIRFRDKSDAQASTSSLKMVEYLPYYYLGQAHFFSGELQSALDNFQKELKAGAVRQTPHLRRLERLIEITKELIQFAELQNIEKEFTQLLNFIIDERYNEANHLLVQLKLRYPQNSHLLILERWLQQSQRKVDQLIKPLESTISPAQLFFNKGLNYFLLGQYENALQEFRAAVRLDPRFSSANSWITKTRREIERLNLDKKGSQKEENKEPEIIEKIITKPTEPVLAITSPTKFLSETSSPYRDLTAFIYDDQGIDSIKFTLNGELLLHASKDDSVYYFGPRSIIDQLKSRKKTNFEWGSNDTAKLDFNNYPTQCRLETEIPLRMGENEIVVVAYNRKNQTIGPDQRRVFRKRPFYLRATFLVPLTAGLLVVISLVFINKRVKYRVAIVNKYNPYIAGSPIRNTEMFFGREKLVKRILNTLHNNSLMVYGPRRIGKTSLQHQLKLRLEKARDPEFHFVPVMIDLQGTTEDHFFITLMEEILENCKHQLNGASFQIHENKSEYSGREFSKDLKTVIQILSSKTDKKLKLVLLIDEVDELNKYSEQVNQKMRSVFMKTFAENLVAVMSGSYIRKDWASEGSPWYNFFEEIEVPPFDQEDARKLIREPVNGIFSYDDAAVEKIIQYSECKPFIIQKFCVNVINRIIEHKRRRVTVEDVEAVRQQVLRSDDV
jgi:tetratricopeptide (TPR) repeat protein